MHIRIDFKWIIINHHVNEIAYRNPAYEIAFNTRSRDIKDIKIFNKMLQVNLIQNHRKAH